MCFQCVEEDKPFLRSGVHEVSPGLWLCHECYIEHELLAKIADLEKQVEILKKENTFPKATGDPSDWETIWAPILEKEDGSIDKEQLKKELMDYGMVLSSMNLVISNLTCGRLSKPNILPDTIISEAREALEEEFNFFLIDELKGMDVGALTKWVIEKIGADGLFFAGECACKLDDLIPCSELTEECTPGFLVKCGVEDCPSAHDFCIHVDENTKCPYEEE